MNILNTTQPKKILLNFLELVLYVLLGVSSAAFLPGVEGERPPVLLVSGGILGLLVYINLSLMKIFKEKTNTLGSYVIPSILYTTIILLYILIFDAPNVTYVANGLSIGLLLPLVLLLLSTPVILAKQAYFFVKLKKYKKITEILKRKPKNNKPKESESTKKNNRTKQKSTAKRNNTKKHKQLKTVKSRY